MRNARAGLYLPLLLACLTTRAADNSKSGEPAEVIQLWPKGAPGESRGMGEERDMTKPADGWVAGKPLIRLGNVSDPTIAVYSPPASVNTGAAVLVCPGGGYHILALDLEGTEVCQWLNSIGVTGVLLKYRVPRRPDTEKHALPLQDAQRSLGLVRHRAKDFGVDPQRIGVLGFSAGGHLAAALSNNYEQRTYPVLEAADAVSCRPDFAVLIYPGYLTVKDENDRIPSELKIDRNTPSTFIAITQDDPVRVETALFYTLALHQAKVPVELHVYPSGGHGYGLRPSPHSVTSWPKRVEEWFHTRGWLDKIAR